MQPAATALQMVNRHLRTLGPLMNRLQSTGVYFTAPGPMDAAPLLPGKLIKAASADVPVMVGEFASATGEPYAMVVNLSLAKSTRVGLEFAEPYRQGSVLSAEGASELPMDDGNAYWLVAGQGILVRLR